MADTLGQRASQDDGVNHLKDWRYAGGTKGSNSFDADRLASPQAPKLSFFRNRAYDQETGQWTQEDPIGVAGGLNLYQFNGNNPVAYTDPFGLCPPKESCLALAALRASGQSSMTAPGFQKGSTYNVGGYNVFANQETDLTISQSKTTGNAVVSFVGDLEVQNVLGPLDVNFTSGAVDLGTGNFEAHGHPDVPAGQLVGVHVKGNVDKGATGACVIICFPLPEKNVE